MAILRCLCLCISITLCGACQPSLCAVAPKSAGNQYSPYTEYVGSLPNQSPGSNGPRDYLKLARYWAPVISQDIDDDNVRADYIAAFDFDGDMFANNNWANLDNFAVDPYVYYWVIESPERYFIGYGFFHPRDWQTAGSHVNDLEGALISIVKDDSLPGRGRFEGMITVAHTNIYGFADDDTPSDSPWFDQVSISQSVTGEKEDVDFLADDSGLHPTVYLQAEGHAAFGHPLHPAPLAWDTIDDFIPTFIQDRITNSQGVSWSGVLSPPAARFATDQSTVDEDWGDGITYHFEFMPDRIAPAQVTDKDLLPHNWQVVGYDLLSMGQLWDCRFDSRVFQENHYSFQPDGGANAPWSWGSSYFFVDPARMFDETFDGGLHEPKTTNCNYQGNSFGAPVNDCPRVDVP